MAAEQAFSPALCRRCVKVPVMGKPYKRGGVWYTDFSAGGKRVRRRIGRVGAKEAAAAQAKLESEAFAGTFFEERYWSKTTLAGLWAEWQSLKTRKKTLRWDAVCWRAIEKSLGGSRRVSSLQLVDVMQLEGDLRAVVLKRTGKPYAIGTINKHMTLLRSLVNLMRKRKQIQNNPFEGYVALKGATVRKRLCSREELRALLAGSQSADMKLAIQLALFTAARQSELAGIRCDDVDFRQGYVTVANAKIGGTRQIPLHEVSARLLRERIKTVGDGKLFRIKPQSMAAQFCRLTDKLGIKDLTFHDFRHTAITAMVNEGANLFTLQQVTGHRRLEMLARYYTTTDVEYKKTIRGTLALAA